MQTDAKSLKYLLKFFKFQRTEVRIDPRIQRILKVNWCQMILAVRKKRGERNRKRGEEFPISNQEKYCLTRQEYWSGLLLQGIFPTQG